MDLRIAEQWTWRVGGLETAQGRESEGTTAVDQVAWTATVKWPSSLIPWCLFWKHETRQVLRPRQATELDKGFGVDGQFRGPVLPNSVSGKLAGWDPKSHL